MKDKHLIYANSVVYELKNKKSKAKAPNKAQKLISPLSYNSRNHLLVCGHIRHLGLQLNKVYAYQHAKPE